MGTLANIVQFGALFIVWLLALLWLASHAEGLIRDSAVIGNAILALVVCVSLFAAYSMTYYPPGIDDEATCIDRQGQHIC